MKLTILILLMLACSVVGCAHKPKPMDNATFDSMMVRMIMAKGWPRDKIIFGNAYSQGLDLPMLFVNDHTGYILGYGDSIPSPENFKK